jgi:hypothetical protein
MKHNFHNNCHDAFLNIFFLMFFHTFFCNLCYASGPSGISPMESPLAMIPFFHLLIFIVGSPILFFKYEIRSARQWKYLLVLLLEYFFMVVAMVFINYLAAIILLAFGLVGANKWRMNQEKLYITDEKKSKADKLVLFILSFPIVVVFFMLLLRGKKILL